MTFVLPLIIKIEGNRLKIAVGKSVPSTAEKDLRMSGPADPERDFSRQQLLRLLLTRSVN